MDAHLAVADAARESYSQLVAFLAARAGGNVASAEDALSDAFLAALKQWPEEGVPANPPAWLLTTARRRLMDSQRRSQTRVATMEPLSRAIEAAQAVVDAGHDFPDERLKLLFVCAHPAIDPAVRTPLMLQTVLGLGAEQIAAAFLTSQPTMSQRLVRAKGKIRDAGIPFTVPAREEWPERLTFVLDAIYAAFSAGWGSQDDLATEAIWLGRVLSHLLPDEPEVLGLLSLMLHCHARATPGSAPGNTFRCPSRTPPYGTTEMIAQAESMLNIASDIKHRAASSSKPPSSPSMPAEPSANRSAGTPSLLSTMLSSSIRRRSEHRSDARSPTPWREMQR
jgi:RNA polymerase sigma-70 factor (ECF subfamily)